MVAGKCFKSYDYNDESHLVRMTSQDGGVNPLVLQDLIEKVVLLRQAVNKGGRQVTPTSNPILRARLQ